jgi:hypothetical protein
MEIRMKLFVTTATLCLALLLTAACSSSTSNSNTAKPAQPATAGAAPTSTPANPASSTAAAQDFTLVNKTGVEIDKVFISPHDGDDWEEDILGRDTLPDGQSVDIKFHRSETAPMWDLRVEDSKGNAIEWENLNLLQISKATLHYENGKATAEVE